MTPFWFDSQEEQDRAVEDLQAMGPAAKRLLSECVESQGVNRQKESKAASDLESAGFVLIRDLGSIFTSEVRITPTLWGEEALEALEEARKSGGRSLRS